MKVMWIQRRMKKMRYPIEPDEKKKQKKMLHEIIAKDWQGYRKLNERELEKVCKK